MERLSERRIIALKKQPKQLKEKRMLLIPGTGNRERESGNECTAVTRQRIQNGGRTTFSNTDFIARSR